MNPNKIKFRRTGTDFSKMSWGDLTRLALEKGVFKVGMTRAEVEAALSQ